MAKKKKPKKPAKTSDRSNYGEFRKSQGEISRKRSEEGREIGPLPEVANPKRRARCAKSHELFAKTYFPVRFKLKSAECHVTAGKAMEEVVGQGGSTAIAMPRGTGKTAHAEVELLRAIFYGLRRFGVLLQATEKLAVRALKRVQRELERNDLLLADFPEVCYPIRKLERINHRARGQTLNGQPTLIEWTKEGIILPTVEGSVSSGAAIMITGIEGASRGLAVSGPDGSMLRPDFVLIDDAQTRATARSPSETDLREAIITDDILGMVGPGETIAAIMLCTPIYVNDLSERFLTGERHPQWEAIRTRMIEAWPANMDLWEQYDQVRRESLKSGDRGKRATAFYRANRAAMDAGARISWPERKRKGDLSGLQTALNLWFDNPRGFKAEYNCEPEPIAGPNAMKELNAALVAKSLSGLARFEVPREASRVVAFIDAGGGKGRGLWYVVVAFDNEFGGSVIDYGTWPRQGTPNFSGDNMKPGLAEFYPHLGEDERLYAGLGALAGETLGREYKREITGDGMKIERCLIDCGYKNVTVYKFIRESQFAAILLPSKGIARTQSARGVSEWKARPGERLGFHWRLTLTDIGRGRQVQFDPDMWKTALHDRMTTAPGGRGRITLFAREPGHAGQPERDADHEMFAEHLAAEYAEPKEVRGHYFDKWLEKPHHPDNHWLDCLTGCCVAASVQGLVWSPGGTATSSAPRAAKPKLKLSELFAAKNR